MAISRTTITTEPMREPPAKLTPEQVDARRKAVRRTALVLALIAVAIYAGFILTGSP